MNVCMSLEVVQWRSCSQRPLLPRPMAPIGLWGGGSCGAGGRGEGRWNSLAGPGLGLAGPEHLSLWSVPICRGRGGARQEPWSQRGGECGPSLGFWMQCSCHPQRWEEAVGGREEAVTPCPVSRQVVLGGSQLWELQPIGRTWAQSLPTAAGASSLRVRVSSASQPEEQEG